MFRVRTLFINTAQMVAMLVTLGVLGFACSPAEAAIRIEGQVHAGGGPLANSTVTLWAASAGEPKHLAQARSGSDGRFELASQDTPGADVVLYLVAKGGEATVNKGSGDNPAVVLLAVVGNLPPSKVVVNEMTTLAFQPDAGRNGLDADLSQAAVLAPRSGVSGVRIHGCSAFDRAEGPAFSRCGGM
jgi:hypothetical protein